MKHLLNNISEEEKNRIREQHEGGMNLAIDNFKKLVETKLGDAKPYLTEASQETCEACGGMMVEGECVEQCGSVKEEVSEQSSNAKQVAGPFSENQKESDIIKYYIFQDGSKFYIYMTDRTRKEPTLMDGSLWDNDGKGYPNQMEAKKNIDAQLKKGMHSSIKLREKPGMSEELDEQVRLRYLSIPEIESLAKEIVTKLDDNLKNELRRLDMSNEKQRIMLMNQILELVGINTDKMGGGPLG